MSQKPVLLDTMQVSVSKIDSQLEVSPLNLLYYIGKIQDTIYLDLSAHRKLLLSNQDPNYRKYSDTAHFCDPSLTGVWSNSKHASLKIEVDTSMVIAKQISGEYYESYPVLIQNLSNHKTKIGITMNIELELQVLNHENKWVNAEPEFELGCSNGIKCFSLLPGEIAISSVLKYRGTIRSKFRVKLGRFYSNEFFGFFL